MSLSPYSVAVAAALIAAPAHALGIADATSTVDISWTSDGGSLELIDAAGFTVSSPPSIFGDAAADAGGSAEPGPPGVVDIFASAEAFGTSVGVADADIEIAIFYEFVNTSETEATTVEVMLDYALRGIGEPDVAGMGNASAYAELVVGADHVSFSSPTSSFPIVDDVFDLFALVNENRTAPFDVDVADADSFTVVLQPGEFLYLDVESVVQAGADSGGSPPSIIPGPPAVSLLLLGVAALGAVCRRG